MTSIESIEKLLNELSDAKSKLINDTYNYAIAHGLLVRLSRLKNTIVYSEQNAQKNILNTIEQTNKFLKAIK